MATHQPVPVSTPTAQREDFKKRWLVDERGFFTHDSRGTYLPQANRIERPALTQVNYDLLIKHNEKAYIDKIFKVNQ